jgi:hypothetical protein
MTTKRELRKYKRRDTKHSKPYNLLYLESESQFLSSEARRFPDEFGRIDPPPSFRFHSFVLFENGRGDDEVMLTFVKLEELQDLAAGASETRVRTAAN